MKFRKAQIADVEAISNILQMAVCRMLSEGKQQWDLNYPNMAHVLADIEKGIGYVIENQDAIIAYGAVVFDGEPAYEKIEGSWLSDYQYVVVHRMAVNQHNECRGVGFMFLKSVEALAQSKGIKSFRIDTNFDNDRMLHLAEKYGFTYCGEIFYEKGMRKAFEKIIALRS